MTHRMLLIGAMCLATLALTTCSNEHNPVSPLPPIEIDQFPMTVGSRWLYSAEDTVQGLIDTIEVEIARVDDTSNGQLTTVWHYQSRHNQIGRVTEYVTVLADTVYFQGERTRSSHLKLVFPIAGGASWSDLQAVGLYVTEVEAEAPTIVPAGTFQAFKVRTDVDPKALDIVLGSRVWLAPGVGFVKIEHIFGHRIPEQYQIWTLLSYTPAS